MIVHPERIADVQAAAFLRTHRAQVAAYGTARSESEQVRSECATRVARRKRVGRRKIVRKTEVVCRGLGIRGGEPKVFGAEFDRVAPDDLREAAGNRPDIRKLVLQ